MSELQGSKVVVLDEFRKPKEKKLRWRNKLHSLRVLQIPVGIAIAVFVIYGSVLSAKEVGYSSGTIWAFAFWLMFLFWACEFHIRKDYYLVKKPD